MRNSLLDNVVAIVGRQDSGKTTLVERLVPALTARGLTVSSLKHHGHPGFQIDVPGKDSFRHHASGTLGTAILSPDRLALVEESERDDCWEAASLLPASNVVLVEGFRDAGFPTVELVRGANPRDRARIPALIERMAKASGDAAPSGGADGEGDVSGGGAAAGEGDMAGGGDETEPLPAAVVTDRDDVAEAARKAGVPSFGFDETARLAAWIEARFSVPLYTMAIQAGGESRRMGRPKALVPFLGVPLVQHVAARVAPGSAELLVTTNQPDDLHFLRGMHPGIRLVPDVLDRRGALPGLVTALQSATFPLVGVVACDMVEAPAALVRHAACMLEKNPAADAVVPRSVHGLEPLCAVYRREPCLAAARACLDAGAERLRDVLDAVTCLTIDARTSPLAPKGCFRNVNTPEELAQACAESVLP